MVRLRIAASLGLFDQGFDLLLHVLHHSHALLPLLDRDLQVFPDLNIPVQQAERPRLLQLARAGGLLPGRFQPGEEGPAPHVGVAPVG